MKDQRIFRQERQGSKRREAWIEGKLNDQGTGGQQNQIGDALGHAGKLLSLLLMLLVLLVLFLFLSEFQLWFHLSKEHTLSILFNE